MYLEKIFVLIIPIVIIDILIFVIFKLYQSLWQFASVTELKNIIIACLIASLSNLLLSLVFNQYITTSFYFIYFLILIITVGGNRFCYRIIRLYTNKYNNQITKPVKDRVLIVGAGVAGEKVLREINNSNHIYKEVVCFIDDEPSKWKRQIHGVDIYGGRNKIIEAVEKYGVSEILVAMPSISKKELANILNICKETRCQIKRLPGIYQFINDDIHISDFKDVEVQDLLGREPIKVNLDDIMGYVTGKVVMVTGGGGSIGSELCRQIAKPETLIIVDIYENNAYDIQLELRRKYPDLHLETMIASVRNSVKVDKLFETYHPDIVYHAAAHKHVPLMEDSPNEAVKNNVFGTLNVVKAVNINR